MAEKFTLEQLDKFEIGVKQLISFIAKKFKEENYNYLTDEKKELLEKFINGDNIIVSKEEDICKYSPNIFPGPGRYDSKTKQIILTPVSYARSYAYMVENSKTEKGKKLLIVKI